MKLVFAEQAWEDDLWWQRQDTRIVKRINDLIEAAAREPLGGIGKPEPLKHALAGWGSRRITDEHRMVCKPEKDALWIAQLRFHC